MRAFFNVSLLRIWRGSIGYYARMPRAVIEVMQKSRGMHSHCNDSNAMIGMHYERNIQYPRAKFAVAAILYKN